MLLEIVLNVQNKVKEIATALNIVSSPDQVVGFSVDRQIIIVWKSGAGNYQETELPLYYLMMTKEEYTRDREDALRRREERAQDERNDLFFQWLDAKNFLEKCQQEGLPIARYGKKYDECMQIYTKYKDTFGADPLQKELEDPPEEQKLSRLMCDTCGAKPGRTRVDNSLPCGVHCDECWDKMITECKSRSY